MCSTTIVSDNTVVYTKWKSRVSLATPQMIGLLVTTGSFHSAFAQNNKLNSYSSIE
jgi:hypothetical protein